VPNAGTAWHQALSELGRYYERVLTKHPGAAPPGGPPHLAGLASPCEVPDDIRDLLGSFVERMVSLGACAAELHRGLASLKGPDLQPEPDSAPARRSEYQTLRNLSGAAVRELREAFGRLTGDALHDAAIVLELRARILERFEPLLVDHGQAMRIRTHGDFHLEQVLFTGKDFVVLDFDGELDRSYNDRRRRRSPLRDIACMLCSIDNAALVTLREPGTVREADAELLSPWASLWSSWMSAMLLSGYFRGIAGTSLVPQGPEQIMGLLDAFALERTLRDLREELGWAAAPGRITPLRALVRMLQSDIPKARSV
jgi:maltose alpha-D-glucosyltransferase/alpha-amylase